MTRSDSIGQLAAALSVAQGAIQNAAKDSANPFFNSSYADLASVRDAIREPFAANGLSVIQLPSADGPRVTITTILAHSSGEWVSSDLTMTSEKSTPQAIGSAITYARRYALAAVSGVAPEDDDGEGAHDRKKAAKDVAEKKLSEMPKREQRDRPERDPRPAANQNQGPNSTAYEKLLGSFAELKKGFAEINQPEAFYNVLEQWSVKEPGDFYDTPEGLNAARKCYKQMGQSLAVLRDAHNHPEPEVEPVEPVGGEGFPGEFSISDCVKKFTELKDRLKVAVGPGWEKAYRQVLGQHGVQKSNEFRTAEAATPAYIDLLNMVKEYEKLGVSA